jgi:hypothetical protein
VLRLPRRPASTPELRTARLNGDDLARSSPFAVSGVGVQRHVISYLAELGADLRFPDWRSSDKRGQ